MSRLPFLLPLRNTRPLPERLLLRDVLAFVFVGVVLVAAAAAATGFDLDFDLPYFFDITADEWKQRDMLLLHCDSIDKLDCKG